MSHTSIVEFSVGDFWAEVEVEFDPPKPYRWNEPPDGGEIFMPNDAIVVVDDGERPFSEQLRKRIPMSEFLDLWMEATGESDRRKAERNLEDHCFDLALQMLADDFDDRDG